MLGHSPCGECGLKLALLALPVNPPRSLPMRGVWIEILPQLSQDKRLPVTPHAGSVD